MSINTSAFQINGMHCDACVRLITKRVNAIEGVQVQSLTTDGELMVQSERNVLADEVREVLKETSYEVKENL